MDINSIDWNKVWKEKRKNRPSKKSRSNEFWNQRAPSFAQNTTKSIYAKSFLKIIKPKKSWTVLDMGCGAGTIALPLSPLVKEITAVDYSEKMIEILRKSISKKKIKNIKPVLASWEDDWTAAGIGKYDIAIASRSLSVDDIENAVTKLNNSAKFRVYITTVVRDGPQDRGVFEAVGRDFPSHIDYIYIYNLLYSLGIFAEITFITERYAKIFNDHENAFESVKWMLDDMTDPEKDRLRDYLKKHLVRNGKNWTLDYERIVRWAVIWWDKEKGYIF